MAGNYPICSKFNDSRIILRSADLLCPFLIAVRKAVIIVFVAQGIRKNVPHTLHTVLPHHLISCTIAKVHPIIIVRNRFMDCLLTLAVQPIGCTVQIHLVTFFGIAERLVVDRHIRIVLRAVVRHRHSLFNDLRYHIFFFRHIPFFRKILFYRIQKFVIEAVPQILCHQLSLLIDCNAGRHVTVFLMLQQKELLAANLRFINGIPCAEMPLDCDVVGIAVDQTTSFLLLFLHKLSHGQLCAREVQPFLTQFQPPVCAKVKFFSHQNRCRMVHHHSFLYCDRLAGVVVRTAQIIAI